VTCREFTDRLADHLDEALPHRADRAVRRHAAACGSCRAYLAQYRVTTEAVRALAEWDDLECDEVLDVTRLLAASASGPVH
jgi:hypothetical protein